MAGTLGLSDLLGDKSMSFDNMFRPGGSSSSSSVSGINYIANYGAENDTSGWVTYDDSLSTTSSAGLVTEGTDTINLNNSFVEGEKILYYTSGTVIGGLSNNTVMYASSVTSTTFKLANAPGGSVFNLTDDGVGTQYFKQVRPLDGTGGSANITWTRTTSSPLRDNASFLFTQGSTTASRCGEGVSYDFTIDSADKGLPLCISFDYVASTGNLADAYAESGLCVYIYDVTNSVMIEPNSRIVPATYTDIYNKYIGYFQAPTNSISYRLIIHCSQTTPSSLAVKIDNVSVGPEKLIYGYAGTDEKSYTPTGNWSANTSYSATWRRVGELAEVNLTVSLSGAPSGNMTFTSAQILNGTGLSLDTTKLAIISGNMSRSLGHGTVFDSGTTSYVASAYWSQADSVIYVSTAANNIISATNPVTFANGDRVVLRLYLPIAGWSSNVQMSSDTDTRVTAFSGYVISHALTADTTLITLTADKDTHGGWVTNTYTVKVPGDYVIGATILSSSGAGSVYVVKNGSKHKYLSSCNTVYYSGGSVYMPSLVSGDTISFKSDTNITITGTTVGGGVTSTFHITRISGPATIAVNEKIQAVYKIASGVTSDTSTPISFATKTTDTHSAVSTSPWKFTAPASGTYLITATLAISAGTAEIRVYKNGSDGGLVLFDANATYSLGGSAQIDLVAGDYIDLRSASSVTLLNNSRYNISIVRVK